MLRKMRFVGCGLVIVLLAACTAQSAPSSASVDAVAPSSIQPSGSAEANPASPASSSTAAASDQPVNPPAAATASSAYAAQAPTPASVNPPADPSAQAGPQQPHLSVDELLSRPAAQPAPGIESASTAYAATDSDGNEEDSPSIAAWNGDDADYARVVSVKRLSASREVCTNRTVVERRHHADHHQVAGTVIGGVVGGLIGNTIGRGTGRALATAGGLVAGGLIGRDIQRHHQRHDTVARVVRRCRPVAESGRGAARYDVVYAYQGQTFHARLDHDPGERLKLPVRSIE